MDAMLAMGSALLVFMCALCIFDASARSKYKERAFFIAIIICSGLVCYISLSNLPDSRNYPWYWKAAIPVGIFLIGVISTFFVFASPKGNRKGK
jgi:amino acid permease